MDHPYDTREIVRIVTSGLQADETESAVVERLVSAGVPTMRANQVFTSVRTACRQGVQSVITNGLSAPDGPPNDPLLAEAFRVGRGRMRRATQRAWMERLSPLVLVALVIGIAVWLLLT